MNTELIRQDCLAGKSSKIVGIAADFDGLKLKDYLVKLLRQAGATVIDFGEAPTSPSNDSAEFVLPLAYAVATKVVHRGIAICGSGVRASVIANQVPGARACLLHDSFSAHQGVEDDDLNIICLGGLVVGLALAWELVCRFLTAQYAGNPLPCRNVGKLSDQGLPVSLPPLSAKETRSQIRPDGAEPASPVNDPLRIYLIRHGDTEWTLARRHTSSTDLAMTALGEEEVREWGPHFFEIPFSQVFTSPRQRARRTCELVGLSAKAVVENDLAEWNFGTYEGMLNTEICKDRPAWNLFRDGCLEGESPAEIKARADRLIIRLKAMSGNVALFSHSQFGSVLAARWLGMAVEQAQHFPLGIASFGILANDPDDPDVRVLKLWNSTPRPHLIAHSTVKQQAL